MEAKNRQKLIVVPVWCVQFNCVQLFAALWTGADQAPLSMGVPRQEYWRGLPFPSPGYLPDPEIKPMSRVFNIGRLILCDPMDCSLPVSSIHGILQTRILDCVAVPSSRGSSWPKNQTPISYVSRFGRWVFYHWHHMGSPRKTLNIHKSTSMFKLEAKEQKLLLETK